MSAKTLLNRASSAGLGRRQTAQTETRCWNRTAWTNGIFLLAAALATACQRPTALVVVNSTDQVITAVFAPNGTDLLAGAQLPPSTFVEVRPRKSDTGRPGILEAYTTTGACAMHAAEPGRWELHVEDLDPSGC